MSTKELIRPTDVQPEAFSSEEAKRNFIAPKEQRPNPRRTGRAIASLVMAAGLVTPPAEYVASSHHETEKPQQSAAVLTIELPKHPTDAVNQQATQQEKVALQKKIEAQRKAEEMKRREQEKQKAEETKRREQEKQKAEEHPKPVAGMNQTQMDNATIIVQTVEKRSMPEKAKTVAIATALQESTLFNHANSKVPKSMDIPHERVGENGTSVGLFQQQVGHDGSGAPYKWGPVEQAMNPVKSTEAFLDELEKVPGWEKMPVTVAAQEVQASAHPTLYADDEVTAKKITAAINDSGK